MARRVLISVNAMIACVAVIALILIVVIALITLIYPMYSPQTPSSTKSPDYPESLDIIYKGFSLFNHLLSFIYWHISPLSHFIFSKHRPCGPMLS